MCEGKDDESVLVLVVADAGGLIFIISIPPRCCILFSLLTKAVTHVPGFLQTMIPSATELPQLRLLAEAIWSKLMGLGTVLGRQ